MQIKAVLLSFLLVVFLVILSRAESDNATNTTTEPDPPAVTVMMVPGPSTMMAHEVSTMMVPVAPPPDLECLDNGGFCTHDDSSVSWENFCSFDDSLSHTQKHKTLLCV